MDAKGNAEMEDDFAFMYLIFLIFVLINVSN